MTLVVCQRMVGLPRSGLLLPGQLTRYQASVSRICYWAQSASVLPSTTVHKKLFETLSLNTSVLQLFVLDVFVTSVMKVTNSMFRGFKGSWDVSEQNGVWCLYHKNQVLEGLPDVCVYKGELAHWKALF